MTVRSRGIFGAAASAAVLAAVVVVAFVGASLVGIGQGGPSPTLQELLDTTPAPPWISPYPTQDPSLPTQPADDTNRTPDPNATVPGTPDSVTISGVDIPIPEGSLYFHGSAPGIRILHWVWKGDSSIRFDDYGLTFADVGAPDEDAFDPTLEALWTLAQTAATPSLPSPMVNGEPIPLPEGSFYSTVASPPHLDNPLLYIVRLSHSVLIFDANGVQNDGIMPADAATFQSTLAALDSLAQAD